MQQKWNVSREEDARAGAAAAAPCRGTSPIACCHGGVVLAFLVTVARAAGDTVPLPAAPRWPQNPQPAAAAGGAPSACGAPPQPEGQDGQGRGTERGPIVSQRATASALGRRLTADAAGCMGVGRRSQAPELSTAHQPDSNINPPSAPATPHVCPAAASS